VVRRRREKLLIQGREVLMVEEKGRREERHNGPSIFDHPRAFRSPKISG